MHTLVIVVMAIALGAVALAAGVWSLGGTDFAARPQGVRIRAGVVVIESAARAARSDAGLPQGTAVLDAAGWAAWPPAAGRTAPDAPPGLVWSYAGDGAAAWVCLSGASVDAPLRRAMAAAVAASPRRAAVTSACGAAGAAPAAPGPAALSVRIARPSSAGVAPAAVAPANAPVPGAPVGSTVRDVRLTGAAGALLAGASDADGDALATAAAFGTSERGGSYAVRPDGGFAYTPPAGWSGTDGFPFQVVDGRGGSAVGRMAVTVAP